MKKLIIILIGLILLSGCIINPTYPERYNKCIKENNGLDYCRCYADCTINKAYDICNNNCGYLYKNNQQDKIILYPYVFEVKNE